MGNKQLNDAVKSVENFKSDNAKILRKNINDELTNYKKTLPVDLLTEDLETKIEEEVNHKLTEFNESIDLNPRALYYSLKTDMELKQEVSEKELTYNAYNFLEKNTKNKFLKKILKEMKKEMKK